MKKIFFRMICTIVILSVFFVPTLMVQATQEYQEGTIELSADFQLNLRNLPANLPPELEIFTLLLGNHYIDGVITASIVIDGLSAFMYAEAHAELLGTPLRLWIDLNFNDLEKNAPTAIAVAELPSLVRLGLITLDTRLFRQFFVFDASEYAMDIVQELDLEIIRISQQEVNEIRSVVLAEVAYGLHLPNLSDSFLSITNIKILFDNVVTPIPMPRLLAWNSISLYDVLQLLEI